MVGEPLGQAAELDRGAAGDAGACAAARRDSAAWRHQDGSGSPSTINSPAGRRAGLDWLRLRDAPAENIEALGAVADHAAPDKAERRRDDDAQRRRSAGDHSDIDRIFGTAGDEFARAVERVDQEIIGAGSGLLPLGLFFRDHRQAWRKPRSPSRMIASAVSSAGVTGEPSALMRTS